MKDDLIKFIENSRTEILDTLKFLYDHPEPAFAEKETSAFLANQLELSGFRVKTGIGGTGIIGVLESEKPGPCVGFRADMDAVMHEIDGKTKPIHTCGHDANCTSVLFAGKALAACNAVKKGSLRIVFQPAEETLQGAKKMLESGEMNGLDYLISSHVRPIEELGFGKISPHVRHAASDTMLVEVSGKPAHSARPHLGINAAQACVDIAAAVNSLRLFPVIPHTANVLMIKSGGASYSTIPDKAEMAISLIAQTNAQLKIMKERVTDMVEKAAAVSGATVRISFRGGIPAARYNEELVKAAEKAIEYVLGRDGVGEYIMTLAGDDFHEFAAADQNLKTTVLGIGADTVPGLHNPEMTYNREAVFYTAKAFAVLAHDLLEQ